MISNFVIVWMLFLLAVIVISICFIYKNYSDKKIKEGIALKEEEYIKNTLSEYKFDGILGDIFSRLLTITVKNMENEYTGLFICGYMNVIMPSDMFDIPVIVIPDKDEEYEIIIKLSDEEAKRFKMFLKSTFSDRFTMYLNEGYILLNMIKEGDQVVRKILKVI